MNLSDIRFPRALEADHTAEDIRRALMARTATLEPGGELVVAVITMSDPLKKALQAAGLKGRIRYGLDPIMDRLESEAKGIANVRERQRAPYGDRVSRLLLFSNDGAGRFYRQIERLLLAHAPRVFGCLLDIDSIALGQLLTGKNRTIKLLMAEHKEAVSEILRTMA